MAKNIEALARRGEQYVRQDVTNLVDEFEKGVESESPSPTGEIVAIRDKVAKFVVVYKSKTELYELAYGLTFENQAQKLKEIIEAKKLNPADYGL